MAAERGLESPPWLHCPTAGAGPVALWARYPNWSNPIVQDPSMFGSKFLLPWQVPALRRGGSDV